MIPKIKDISVRSTRLEILDEKQFTQEELTPILRKIALVNKRLGGNAITLKSISRHLGSSHSRKLKIVDVGCGGGDMCRAISTYFSNSTHEISIIGIDINELSLKIAQEESKEFNNIQYKNIDVFSQEFVDLAPDIIVSTLTMHHFTDEDLLRVLSNCLKIKDVYIVINDLHRSRIAYYFFIPISYILGMGYYNRHDGLLSILRGFRRNNFIEYSNLLRKKYPNFSTRIQWKWAFRYLWTIKNI